MTAELNVGVPMSEPVDAQSLSHETDPGILKQIFIGMGGNPSWKRVGDAENAAWEKAQSRKKDVDAANPFTSASTQISSAFARLAVVFVGGVIQVAMPVALLLLLIAEGLAVFQGLSLLNVGDVAAGTYAISLVVLLVTMMFIYEIVLRSSTRESQMEFSLRTIWHRSLVIMGFRPAGTITKDLSLAMVSGAVTWVSRAIILLGVLGRLQTILDTVMGVAWYDAILHVAKSATFVEVAGVGTNLAIGFTMLAGTHVIVYLIHRSFVLATGGLDITSDTALDFLSPTSVEDLYQIELADAYRTLIYVLHAQQQKRLASTTNDLPTPSLEPTVTLLPE
jgi:hypothetical protein